MNCIPDGTVARLMSHAMLLEPLHTGGMWSVARGLARNEQKYKQLLVNCDRLQETRRALELDRYFSVLPAFRGLYNDITYDYETVISDHVTNPYISAETISLDKESLKAFLISNNLLDLKMYDKNHPDKRYWPGDDKKERN